MAKTVITTDDIDGSSDAETIEFSYNGVTYSIDLAKKNKAALDKVLKPYIDAAHSSSSRNARAGSGAKARRGRANRSSSLDLAAVRAWAHEQGIAVSERGRVAGTVLEAYTAAH